MTPNQIGVLATEGESETLEFKKMTGERREAAKTMCAMLNTRGGRIVFGITKEGSVAGQQVSDQTIEDVSAEIQRIDPPTFPTIDRIPLGGGRQAIVVSVNQGPMRPHTYRNISATTSGARPH